LNREAASIKAAPSRHGLSFTAMFRLSRSPLLSLALTAVAAIASTAAGGTSALARTVVSRSFHAAALERDWAYTVYLPTGYRINGPRYPVLYLLHGNNGNANDWISQGHLQTTADALIERKEMSPVVIVMPQGGTDWYVDRQEKWRRRSSATCCRRSNRSMLWRISATAG
jgi:enterochelin esterase-like enzyme